MSNISFLLLKILRTLKNLRFVVLLLKYLKHFISSFENLITLKWLLSLTAPYKRDMHIPRCMYARPQTSGLAVGILQELFT